MNMILKIVLARVVPSGSLLKEEKMVKRDFAGLNLGSGIIQYVLQYPRRYNGYDHTYHKCRYQAAQECTYTGGQDQIQDNTDTLGKWSGKK